MTQPGHTRLYSHTFDRDTVSVDLSEYLHYPLKLHVQGWQAARPFHWFSVSGDKQVAEGQFLQSPGLPLDVLTAHAASPLCEGVPSVVTSVCEFAPFLSYELMQACATVPSALDMAEDCPLLLILAVEYAQRHNVTEATFAAWLHGKRPALLASLGLPASSSLARLLKRITLTPVTPTGLMSIRAVLEQPHYLKLLRHQHDLHVTHLRFLDRLTLEAWPGLLNMINADSSLYDMIWLKRMVNDILQMAPHDMRLRQLRTIDELQHRHDQLVLRFNEADNAMKADSLAARHGAFPLAPLAGTEHIVPIGSWKGLLEEGAQMHHCIGSYAQRVAAGHIAVYHMEMPERLTIALSRQGSGWQLQEVRGRCNALPSQAAMEAIQRWLAL